MEDINIQQLIPINEVFKLGQWDWTVLVPYPSDQIKEIINNFYISLDHNTEDTPYWTPAETGNFLVSSSWNLLRHKKPIAPIDSRLWHKDVPYKMSCIAWREIHYRLPTDDKVAKKFKITFVSKCFCCIGTDMIPGIETAEHLFCNGNFAQLVWSFFAGRMGINTRNSNLRDLLHRCWNCTTKNHIAPYILKILPPIIMWELWGSRCNSRYEEEKPSTIRSISLIFFNIYQLSKRTFANLEIPNNWNNLLKLMEPKLVDTFSVAIKWIKPPLLFVKMNLDGSCVGSSSGGGGVVRDSMGNFIMSFILPLGIGTSNTAEANAFLFGLKWCIDNGYNLIIAETDSLLLRNCISESLVTR
ncbi:uncharacterized protein LOC132628804 [Lycium barbarum]|uniref:uncharacterized protein LOC132628804 n=1 Tax=Lycium barbarum TaxID=112863 RepID=UPI00293E2C48|nr:uncharacterized protein LOC132628804 [Lycium barbarum]